MRKNIIIYSHNTHSFLKNEIHHASSVFDRVYLICPLNDELKGYASEFPNVESIFYTNKEIIPSLIKNISIVFNINTIKEINNTRKLGLLSKRYFKVLFQYLFLEAFLIRILQNKIKLEPDKAKEWVILSSWYSGTSYSAAQVKKYYSDIKVVSLAHSFEIDKAKNEFTKVLFRSIYHDNLDKLSFISKNVCQTYINEIATPLNLDQSNLEIRYLGTNKLYNDLNPIVQDETIRIVSCSHVIPIKRVELILKALDSIENYNIEWTHIGDGERLTEIKNLAQKKINNRLKIYFMGNQQNKDIHKLYSSKPFDLFINVSIAEGIPVTLMEAIAYGIPIIATDVGGNSEIVRDEFGKLITADPTITEICNAIIEMKQRMIKEPKNIQKSALKFFDKNFNAYNIRPKFYEEIKRL